MTLRNNYHVACYLCHDSGFVCAVSKDDQTHYAFRCLNCGVAERRKLSLKIPEWNKYRKIDFVLWGEQGEQNERNTN
jgi:hypothetical protein